jgi:peptide chain release factor
MIRLLLTSGRGPAECRIAVRGVLQSLLAAAEAAGLDADAVQGHDPDGNGPYSALAVLHGAGAPTFARGWTGTIQWTAQSPVRRHHKRKNWFVGVVQLEGAGGHIGKLDPRDVRFESFRAGGPGGQHQNKTESAVRATHGPTGLSVTAREERSQHRNKALALERLAKLIAAGRELEHLAEQQRTQAAHDSLERGRPVRRFKGEAFAPV